MKTENHIITLKSNTSPIVELNSDAMAAYIRFSHHKVVRTEVLDSVKSTVTVDFDSSNEVIGIEQVGVKEFTLSRLLEVSGIELRTSNKDLVSDVRYVPAGALVKA